MTKSIPSTTILVVCVSPVTSFILFLLSAFNLSLTTHSPKLHVPCHRITTPKQETSHPAERSPSARPGIVLFHPRASQGSSITSVKPFNPIRISITQFHRGREKKGKYYLITTYTVIYSTPSSTLFSGLHRPKAASTSLCMHKSLAPKLAA